MNLNQSNLGAWVRIDAAKLVQPAEEAQVQVLPSPYDVPVALRINEGDPLDPAYAVEVRYLSGSEERTKTKHPRADIHIEVGNRSGRIYRFIVESKVAAGSRERLRDVVDAIGGLDQKSKNVQMVRRAVQLHEGDLVQQLSMLGPRDYVRR